MTNEHAKPFSILSNQARLAAYLVALFYSFSASAAKPKCEDLFHAANFATQNIDRAIRQIIDFDFQTQRTRGVLRYTQDKVKLYRTLQNSWQTDRPIEQKHSTFYYQKIWDLISDFGRLSEKYPRIQQYIYKNKPGDLSHLIRDIDDSHVERAIQSSPHASPQWEYPVPDVIACLDFAFKEVPKVNGVFIRGGFLLDGMRLQKLGSPYFNRGYISVSEDPNVAKRFINTSFSNLLSGFPKWRTPGDNPKHKSILQYRKLIQIYDFRDQEIETLWMPAVYDLSREKVQRSLYSEREHLLPRGLRLRVRDRTTVKDEHGQLVYIEVVEPDPIRQPDRNSKRL